MDILRSIGKLSGESVQSYLPLLPSYKASLHSGQQSFPFPTKGEKLTWRERLIIYLGVWQCLKTDEDRKAKIVLHVTWLCCNDA